MSDLSQQFIRFQVSHFRDDFSFQRLFQFLRE